MARIVIVGTGIAGLIAAYRASAEHAVVLVTKADLGESNTKYAQGGIAAALFPDDNPRRMPRIPCGQATDCATLRWSMSCARRVRVGFAT